MIVPMLKVFVATRGADRDRLLAALAEIGALHLTPVDPARAVPDEKTTTAIHEMQRALQILEAVSPAGATPDLPPLEAARQVLDLQRRAAEHHSRLASLHRQIEQIQSLWGDTRLESLDRLRAAGLDVRFFSVPAEAASQVSAECVHELRPLPGRRVLVATIDRKGTRGLPEMAEPIPPPPKDAPSIRAEAAIIDRQMKDDVLRLAGLAHLIPPIRAEIDRLRRQADFTLAARGALGEGDLFAVQGYVPANRRDALAAGLASGAIDHAMTLAEPGDDDTPPTLIHYPRWTRPIRGLFRILGTVPGYREFDVSVPFMIALPIFAAILIGDGGYGAVLLLAPLIFYKKASRLLGAEFTQLLCVIGAVAILWGLLTGTFFGVTLYNPPVTVDMSESSRSVMMRLSFVIGAIHLCAAQLWQAAVLYPRLTFLNKVGWATFLWGMLGVVQMFVLGDPLHWHTPWPYLLIAGATLAILFASPSRNVFKTLLLGLANFPLSMLGTFSDIMSYVRLMAVCMASGILAAQFNDMALKMDFLPLTLVALVAGHALDIALAMIALFAHGVRLNILEFSNNLGMQWSGYPYRPFGQPTMKETGL